MASASRVGGNLTPERVALDTCLGTEGAPVSFTGLVRVGQV